MVGVTLCGFDVGGWGCVGLCFVAAAPGCGVVVVALPGCGAFLGCCGWVWGVVCELDSVFVFYACFLFLSCFWLGLPAVLLWCGGFFWALTFCFCSESLILAQDERWRRA